MMPCARSLPLSGSDEALRDDRTFLLGYTIQETGAAAATVLLYDNASAANGTLLAAVELAAGTAVDVVHPVPIQADDGVYVDVTGSVAGAVRIA